MKTISTFDGVTLVSRNEYDDGAVLRHTLTVAPIETAHYWCCWNGRAQAFNGDAQGCIAATEDSLRGLIGERRDNTTMGRVYVISRPVNATQAAWKRWAAKWTKRTANGSAY